MTRLRPPSAAPAPAAVAALAAVVALLLAPLVGAAPAQAQGRVSVTNDRGTAQADTRYQTPLTVKGTGFQSVRGGFGGVYVMFGWVSDPRGGSWRPSRGGLTGEDYQYIPDAEDATANKGYLSYVAFPGSSTSGEAAAVLSESGSFSVTLTVPGPVFQSVDREGDVAEVDCRRTTCGIITIGAHGVKNANNESFTPVTFGTVYDSEPTVAEPTTPAAEDPTQPGATDAPPATDPDVVDDGQDDAPVTTGGATVAVDRATAAAGRALTFVGRGFQPGEQVLAVLDDGVAALGPMVAGQSGEVAGVLQLPVDLPVGTHQLRLTGAASSAVAEEAFPVAAADAPAPVAATEDDDPATAGWVFLVVAAVVFALALGGAVVTLVRRRRAARAPAPVAGSAS